MVLGKALVVGQSMDNDGRERREDDENQTARMHSRHVWDFQVTVTKIIWKTWRNPTKLSKSMQIGSKWHSYLLSSVRVNLRCLKGPHLKPDTLKLLEKTAQKTSMGKDVHRKTATAQEAATRFDSGLTREKWKQEKTEKKSENKHPQAKRTKWSLKELLAIHSKESLKCKRHKRKKKGEIENMKHTIENLICNKRNKYF